LALFLENKTTPLFPSLYLKRGMTEFFPLFTKEEVGEFEKVRGI
jgi:hypothetical protein